MIDLIEQLKKLIAENLQSDPTATVEALVERLQTDDRIIQINSGNSLAFQTLVQEGGIANLGIHLHDDFDEDKSKQVLDTFWKSLQPKEIPNNVPRSGVAKFIGREPELEQLHGQLQQGNLVSISAVEGMGGVGKTELAIQYAHKYASFYTGGICWLFAREFNIATQVIGFAQSRLNLKIPEGLELVDQVAFCWRNWREGPCPHVGPGNRAEIGPFFSRVRAICGELPVVAVRKGRNVTNYRIVPTRDHRRNLVRAIAARDLVASLSGKVRWLEIRHHLANFRPPTIPTTRSLAPRGGPCRKV